MIRAAILECRSFTREKYFGVQITLDNTPPPKYSFSTLAQRLFFNSRCKARHCARCDSARVKEEEEEEKTHANSSGVYSGGLPTTGKPLIHSISNTVYFLHQTSFQCLWKFGIKRRR